SLADKPAAAASGAVGETGGRLGTPVGGSMGAGGSMVGGSMEARWPGAGGAASAGISPARPSTGETKDGRGLERARDGDEDLIIRAA
ncbi:MAG: hypothetical protein JO353_08200, partial [Phycisphaerae bacterium]|nr:hypothetical protein [Phycisphaerae bacterium]